MTKTLVVAAHPDDEVLGCGGTIAKLSAEGARVHVAFLADGVFSRPGDEETRRRELEGRRAAARAACDVLGVASVSFGNFPDNRMDTVAILDVARAVEALVTEHLPEAVFTHHPGDVNVDHQRIHAAVVTACRPQGGRAVKTILSFEVASSTEWQFPGSAPAFAPNWFVDISSTIDRKLAALKAYAVELREWPHPRSMRGVEDLARWRGATIGVAAAEAFMLGRHIA